MSKTVDDIKYNITNKKDIIQRWLHSGNQWNKGIIDLIKNYIVTYNLKHFLNVGAHIGSVSLPISQNINTVTAIEAYPPTFNELVSNIDINNIKNINCLNCAVGNSEEDVYFMNIENDRLKNNSGGMHVFTSYDIEKNIRSSKLHNKNISTKMYKLDDLYIDNFDIMLIDIEGMEYDFFLGGKNVIMKNKPIIISEIWGPNKRKSENMSITREETIGLILSYGYKLVEEIKGDYIFMPV